MGIPMEFTLLYTILVILLFCISMFLLFIEPSFNQAVAALIFCFVNVIISYICAYSYLVISIYGFDSSGVLVENNVFDFYGFAAFFLSFVFINIALMFYAIAICYKKPWEGLTKAYNTKDPWLTDYNG